MKMTIKKWVATATWSWDIGEGKDGEGDHDCGICQLPFEKCCPQCTRPGDDCGLLWGDCQHVFHLHCMMNWLGDHDTCMCFCTWRSPMINQALCVAALGRPPPSNT